MITSRYAMLHDIELILDEEEKGNAETRWNFTFDRVIKILMDQDGMSNDEAIEFFTFNIEGAWVGELTPIWMYPASGLDLQVH